MHLRTHYFHELKEVERRLSLMSAAVERAIAAAMSALYRNDRAAAETVVREDDEIDERRADIEERVLQLINTQHPAATDLRFLLTALHIADDLERIGDYAEGIAALVVRHSDEPAMDAPAELHRLEELVRALLYDGVQAFVQRDPAAFREIVDADDEADDLNRTIRQAMIHQIQANTKQAMRSLHFLFIGHNLERIADRAVDIAERAAFIATGDATIFQHKKKKPKS